MKTVVVATLLLAFCGFVAADYDFMLMTVAWPKSSCMNKPSGAPSCGPVHDYFTVHGMWPENTDGSYPQSCGGVVFDPAALQPIMTELYLYWPDLYYNSTDFWNHEYTKHGSCCTDVLPKEIDYFSQTLKTYHSLCFSCANLPVGTSVSVADVQSKMKAAIGATVHVQCLSKNHEQYLFQIGVCVDKTTFQPFDCPGRLANAACNGATAILP